jgi:rhodanese-related sulfurtransferase
MSELTLSPIPCPVFDDDDDSETFTEEVFPSCPIPILVPSRDPIPRISPAALARLISGEFYGFFEALVVLDCRFPYEFEGGHVWGAINLRSLEEMRDLYDHFLGHTVCFVFHCEFSQVRGSTWAKIFREFVRIRNLEAGRGPTVQHPHVFVLNGGYKSCFEQAYGLTTGEYRPMLELASEEYGLYTQAEANFREQTTRAANSILLSVLADPTRKALITDLPIDRQCFSQPSLLATPPPNHGMDFPSVAGAK